MVNLKKYVYYSKKNPYMKHYKNDSYCVTCNEHYVGKRGGQSHSSKIHHMTLDGKKLNPKKDKKIISEIKADNPKTISVKSDSSSEDEAFHTTMRKADVMMALNSKIVQLEKMGLAEHAEKLRRQHGIYSQQKPADKITASMLLMMGNNETDPARQNLFYALYAAKLDGASDSTIIDMASTFLLWSPAEKPAEKSEIIKQAELLVGNTIKNMNRDPVDDVIRYQQAISKTNNNSFDDDFVWRVKKFKEPKMTHIDILPASATEPVLPSEKRAIPVTITHNRKLPSVRQVFPMGETNFSKDSHDMYFDFDESEYNDDVNMASNFDTLLDCADMSTTHAASN
ncbi:hypothetical protein [Nitrosopumilus sp. Nsub]|uniref:hypothetical protein n=1 Tax=Nitrosopumilus sp. Nsub TaxID=1776294 RepID=UPI000AB08491|nr:hypothetical protein [Nitrosopumilus sp. Nsub]